MAQRSPPGSFLPSAKTTAQPIAIPKTTPNTFAATSPPSSSSPATRPPPVPSRQNVNNPSPPTTLRSPTTTTTTTNLSPPNTIRPSATTAPTSAGPKSHIGIPASQRNQLAAPSALQKQSSFGEIPKSRSATTSTGSGPPTVASTAAKIGATSTTKTAVTFSTSTSNNNNYSAKGGSFNTKLPQSSMSPLASPLGSPAASPPVPVRPTKAPTVSAGKHVVHAVPVGDTKTSPSTSPTSPGLAKSASAPSQVASNHVYSSVDLHGHLNVQVRAVQKFVGADDSELSFEVGDIILLKETDNNPWGFGILLKNKREGWFPLTNINPEDLKNLNIDPEDPDVDITSLVAQKRKSVHILNKRLSTRPTKLELQNANILPIVDTSPALQAAQQTLERKKKGDFLSHFLRKDKKEKKEGVELSKGEITFGGKVFDYDDSATDVIEFSNYTGAKIKWSLECENFNQPFDLSFEPQNGSLGKNKSQQVRITLEIKNITTKDLPVYLSVGGKRISQFVVKIVCKKGVFGVDPWSLPYEDDNGLEVPTILIKMKESLFKYDALAKEGIFRISGESNNIKQLRRQMDRGQFTESKDFYSVAQLLKIWYRELPQPILQSIDKESLYNEDVTANVKALDKVPEPQWTLLQWLIRLVIEVTKKRESNKMTVDNLAIVIAPNLFSSISMDDAAEGLVRTQRSAKFFGNIIAGFEQNLHKSLLKDKISEKVQAVSAARGRNMERGDRRRRSKSVNALNADMVNNNNHSHSHSHSNNNSTPVSPLTLRRPARPAPPPTQNAANSNQNQPAPPLPNAPKPSLLPRNAAFATMRKNTVQNIKELRNSWEKS